MPMKLDILLKCVFLLINKELGLVLFGNNVLFCDMLCVIVHFTYLAGYVR